MGRRLHVNDDRDILAWIRRVHSQMHDPRGYAEGWPAATSSVFGDRDNPVRFELSTPKPEAAFQIARAPLAGTGFHVVELELPWRQLWPEGRYVAAGVLATDLAVHFHHGSESSLVWVTTLGDASPVDAARIAVSDACTGQELWTGHTDDQGLAKVFEPLAGASCPGFDNGLFVSARTQDDLGFVVAERHRDAGASALRVHTILDRSVFQPGETVSMKHVVRQGTTGGFALPGDLPRTMEVKIEHVRSDEGYTDNVDVDATGTALSTLELPKTAKLGLYAITFQHDEGNVWSGELRVEQFLAATMRAAIDGPDRPLVAPSSVPLTLSVKHLAGGGAAYQTVAVRTWIEHDDHFGRAHPDSATRTASITLDQDGEAPYVVGDLSSFDGYAWLNVEFDYLDSNGQVATVWDQYVLWPAALRLEIDQPLAAPLAGRQQRVRIAALDIDGQPVSGRRVAASFHSVRDERRMKRLAGGFHDRIHESKRRFEGDCAGVTDADGILECDVPGHLEGDVVVEANSEDSKGRMARTSHWIRLQGEGILEVAEQREYSPGETVAVTVAVPFAEARALVSVHREGILDAFVTELRGPLNVVEVPIRRNYAPNVEVSVLAIGGRSGQTRPSWQDDDGAVFEAATSALASYPLLDVDGPDARHGVIDVRVTDDAHRLTVDVVPETDTYRTRDNARVRIRVTGPVGRTADGGATHTAASPASDA